MAEKRDIEFVRKAVMVRLPPDIARQLRILAAMRGQSMSREAELILTPAIRQALETATLRGGAEHAAMR